MTAMDTRRTVGVTQFLLPFALIVVLFGISVLLAGIAPSLASGGVYQVTVGQDAAQFAIPAESLTCDRRGNTATCSTPVSGHELRIAISYTGIHRADPSSCTATHAGRLWTAGPPWATTGMPRIRCGSPMGSA